MEAAARKLPRGALGQGRPNNRGQMAGLNALITASMCRQRADCNPGTAKADAKADG